MSDAVCHREEGIGSRAAHPAACSVRSPIARIKSDLFGKHNGLSDLVLRVDLADIDHENDQVP